MMVVVAVAPWLCRRRLFQHIRDIFAEKDPSSSTEDY
jgi:hypothetical protein